MICRTLAVARTALARPAVCILIFCLCLQKHNFSLFTGLPVFLFITNKNSRANETQGEENVLKLRIKTNQMQKMKKKK
jgi:hypothetical protein